MSRSKRILWIVFGLIIVLSMGGALWYKYVYQGSSEDVDQEHQLPAIKITLINGCGFEGLASEFSDFLADKNVDIVSMGNARKPIYDKTIIVVRNGSDEDLKRLERMTGISRFTEARSETALADFDIIIGKDYEQYTKK